jgi:hypothetical protein
MIPTTKPSLTYPKVFIPRKTLADPFSIKAEFNGRFYQRNLERSHDFDFDPCVDPVASLILPQGFAFQSERRFEWNDTLIRKVREVTTGCDLPSFFTDDMGCLFSVETVIIHRLYPRLSILFESLEMLSENFISLNTLLAILIYSSPRLHVKTSPISGVSQYFAPIYTGGKKYIVSIRADNPLTSEKWHVSVQCLDEMKNQLITPPSVLLLSSQSI